MALNCETCKHRNCAVSEGHCTEFSHIPQLDACAMHSLQITPLLAVEVLPQQSKGRTGTYIGLTHPR